MTRSKIIMRLFIKLESVQISGESNPRNVGNPAVKFNNALDNLSNW